MAKENHYGKRYSGSNRVEARGAIGLRVRYSAPSQRRLGYTESLADTQFLRSVIKPDWTPKSEAQRKYAVDKCRHRLEYLESLEKEELFNAVQVMWLSIGELKASIKRLSNG